jgi:hypothetical protein
MPYTQRLKKIMTTPGLEACALVESESGIVIAQEGSLPEMSRIAEAAVEFWRLHWRLNEYLNSDFGSMKQQACFFEHRVLALMPWSQGSEWLLVFVGLPGQVDWVALKANMQ